MIDWQTITVALIILAAAIYTGRLAWLRLRSFRKANSGADSCETGCGSCGDNQKPAATTERTVFVEISRARTSSRGNQR
ncbi:MAG TPA: FeoB-associated Cys-rich membrane protein [Pyrinomonadaceae bacterium]